MNSEYHMVCDIMDIIEAGDIDTISEMIENGYTTCNSFSCDWNTDNDLYTAFEIDNKEMFTLLLKATKVENLSESEFACFCVPNGIPYMEILRQRLPIKADHIVDIQNTMSTGLATFTSSDKKTQMSLAWSAPEILDAVGSTFKSDVYSFGIVIWEIFSREIPWSTLQPKDVYIRVVLKGLRPEIPKNVPGHFVKMMESCWKGEECDRPSFRSVMEDIKSHGWNEKL